MPDNIEPLIGWRVWTVALWGEGLCVPRRGTPYICAGPTWVFASTTCHKRRV
jgi:hypothetical protein